MLGSEHVQQMGAVRVVDVVVPAAVREQIVDVVEPGHVRYRRVDVPAWVHGGQVHVPLSVDRIWLVGRLPISNTHHFCQQPAANRERDTGGKMGI
jgi:hypothetical protein